MKSRLCRPVFRASPIAPLATGAFRNFLAAPLPYELDFPRIYGQIKDISPLLGAGSAADAAAALDAADELLGRAAAALLAADERVTPSLLRRFFEKLKRQDDAIIHNLIRFYFYADAVEGDRRDKLDFLFTRIGEDLVVERGEYVTRGALELRDVLTVLTSVLRVAAPPREEVVRVVRAIKRMRADLLRATTFDELTQRGLLRNARTFKHRIGDLYFEPDVLLQIVELNVAAKNRFLALYAGEEQRLVADARKLIEHGEAIERNFGETNPELAGEISRFRALAERFDSGRAQSNTKADVVAQLKTSINNILAQLDRGLVVDDEPDLPAAFFDETQQREAIRARFGDDELLLPFLMRIASAAESEEGVRELRLEPWEAEAWRAHENDELSLLYLRAAALRIKVDEEATILATATAAGVKADAELLARARASLDAAKLLDAQFGEFLQDASRGAAARFVHQLYRSRFRLLRGFSGLWLIYDRQQ